MPRSRPEEADFRFPHHRLGSQIHPRANSRCPGCGWGLVDDLKGWQFADASGTCRRCGYSQILGKRTDLADQSRVLSPGEVAKLVDVSRRTIYTWILEGWLRGYRLGGRWFVTVPDLDSFQALTRGASGKPTTALATRAARVWQSIP